MKRIPPSLLLCLCCVASIQAAETTPPEKQRVLLIGDSISAGYAPFVIKMLNSEADVTRIKGNAGSTITTLPRIEEMLGETQWDVIHFNWGLHDLCYRHPDSKVQGKRDKQNGTITTSLEDYEKNLQRLIARLKQTNARLIWASTTVVPEGEAGRFAGDELKYNAVAARVMQEHGIQINDLHQITAKFVQTEFVGAGNVHFTAGGSEKLAKQVVASIRETLSHSTKHKRPNILFVLVDDQSPFDLQVYNPKSILETPNIDQLAAGGVVFDAAYHMGSFAGAVCSPSRHMVMCGRTLWHLPIGPLAATHCPPHLEKQTLAAVFNRAGYDTMRTCKKGNCYEKANQQFTVRHDATKRGGTTESGSPWHGDQVMNYLEQRQRRHDEDPFLIYFGFSHPHDTRDGQPALLEKYGAVNHTDQATLPPANSRQPELPENSLPEHPFPHGHPGLRDEVSVSGVWTKRDPQTIRNELGREFACSEAIDVQIGRVVDKLREMGELENTFIVYTSDHGMAIGRHGLQGKQNLYEHTWRVPLIVKGPGIPSGKRAIGNVYLLDTLATLCDLAGVPTPETNEGISYRSVLEGRRSTVRDVLYGAYCGGTKPGMRSVRQGDWKLIKYDVLDGTTRETQLFNLAENPFEFLEEHGHPNSKYRDLAENPEFAEKLAEMEALLLAEMQRLHDPYPLWNQPGGNPLTN